MGAGTFIFSSAARVAEIETCHRHFFGFRLNDVQELVRPTNVQQAEMVYGRDG